MNLLERLRELAALADDERGEFLPELVALAEADANSAGETAETVAADLAQRDATIEALNKRIAELTAHNYELLKVVPSDNGDNDRADDTVDEDEDPIDSLFGDEN